MRVSTFRLQMVMDAVERSVLPALGYNGGYAMAVDPSGLVSCASRRIGLVNATAEVSVVDSAVASRGFGFRRPCKWARMALPLEQLTDPIDEHLHA